MFIRERAFALSNSLDLSTRQSYSSAMNSWIAFINMHNFPVEPTQDTLSFFIFYMSHHIKPRSVKSYLSGLVQQLEPDFPTIREIRTSKLISKVLKGCMKLKSKPICWKEALSIQDLGFLHEKFGRRKNHDDYLFAALLFTGFYGLLRLGDMTIPNDPNTHEWRKISRRSSLVIKHNSYSFILPTHKGDKFYEGNKILIRAFNSHSIDPTPIFLCYLSSRDSLFPAVSPLWLTSEGVVCTYQVVFYVPFSFVFLKIIRRYVHACWWRHSFGTIRHVIKSHSSCWEMDVEGLGTVYSCASHTTSRPPPPPPLSTSTIFSFNSFLFIPPHIAFTISFFYHAHLFQKKKKNFLIALPVLKLCELK